jgi:2-pyrone-4,6-dicarboxylate lactonase
LPRDALAEIAARIAPLGWHIVIYFEAVELPELYDFFTSLPGTVVVDHMGRPDVAKPVDGEEFGRFLKLMREHPNFRSKVSCPERLSKQGPGPMAMTTWFPSPATWSKPSPTACFGAPTGRTPT